MRPSTTIGAADRTVLAISDHHCSCFQLETVAPAARSPGIPSRGPLDVDAAVNGSVDGPSSLHGERTAGSDTGHH